MRSTIYLFFSCYSCVMLQSTNQVLLVSRNRQKLSALAQQEVLSLYPNAQSLNEASESFVCDDSCLSSQYTLVSSLKSSEYIIASASTARELLAQVKASSLSLPDGWGLSYECLSPVHVLATSARQRKEDFSSKSLMCCIAQVVSGDMALSPVDVLVDAQLTIFETRAAFYLCRQKTHFAQPFDYLKDLWARRPFQYSAALSMEVSVAAINILRSMARASYTAERPLTLLDPCCGSGTNLIVGKRFVILFALTMQCLSSFFILLSFSFSLSFSFPHFALAFPLPLPLVSNRLGMNVIGWDFNPVCAEGSLNNINYMDSLGCFDGDQTTTYLTAEVLYSHLFAYSLSQNIKDST